MTREKLDTNHKDGLIFAIIFVLEFPPSESFNKKGEACITIRLKK